MDRSTRHWTRLLVAVVLAVAALATPAMAHAGHESHEGSGLSIWPFFLVFGTVVAAGSLAAGYRLDVPRHHAVGVATGGATMAVIAGAAWFL